MQILVDTGNRDDKIVAFPLRSAMMGKRCPRCQLHKPLDAFCNNRSKKDGKHQWCKPCVKDYYALKGYDGRYRAQRLEYKSRPEIKSREREQAMARKRAHPRDSLGRALIHALNRCPTVNPVTPDGLVEMWEAQNGRCAVTGIEMVWAQGRITPYTVSIDKIDQTASYTKDNVRLICFCVNSFRGTMNDTQMLDVARLIVSGLEVRRVA